MTGKPVCTVPPKGWTCSREAGHEGPCAASQVPPMKIDQRVSDAVFFGKMQNTGDYSSISTLKFIRSTLKTQLNIELSNAEAHEFWRWRSNLWDASFLSTGSENEVVEFFTKFCEEWHDLEPGDEPWCPYED